MKILHLPFNWCLVTLLLIINYSASSQNIKLQTDNILGSILTDSSGMALYYFTRDAGDNFSACSGGCVDNWPIFYTEIPMVGEGLDSSDFSSFMRPDSVMQSTYKGWPLYYYIGDNATGQTNGEAVGNVWFVAKPDYSIMLMNDSLVGNDGVTYTRNYEPGSEVVQFFTDGQGRTLYGFIVDRYDNNNYTNEDFSNDGVWPIYFDEFGSIPSILNASLFNTINVHGRQQLTYKGWPLYYFGPDAARGDTKGVSVPSPGVWPIITSDIEELERDKNILLQNDSILGEILSDADGNTLYYFSRDAGNNFSACKGGCVDNWPIFYKETPIVGDGLDTADFSSFMRSDSIMQSTYKGWPLYYYVGDSEAGETNGEAVGNVWFVAKPDYTIMLMNDSLVGNDGVTYTSAYEPGNEVVQFFTDEHGRTLYGFLNDTYDVNNYTNEDFSNDGVWPIFYDEFGSIPSILDASLFNTINVHGRQQLTYKGWPLYYFGPDVARGDTKGVSVPSPGVWPIITSDINEATRVENILLLEDEILGSVLTDGSGNVLYYFSLDAGNDFSACIDGCVDNWPIFYSETPVVGEGLDVSDFNSFMRSDSVMQSTYKGWPLYYFAGDSEAGQTNGEAVGNVWFVAKPDYAIMLMNDILVGNDGVTYTLDYEPGSQLVQYFTDENGRTLYIWVNDNFDVNNYTNEDFSNNDTWPIYYDEIGSLPSILDASLFNAIDVHGRQQLTYKGWPLYYFGPDTLRGDTKGISVPIPGVWPVAIPGLDEAVISLTTDIPEFSNIVISPNPFVSDIKVNLFSEEQKLIDCFIYNHLGQVQIIERNIVLNSGSNTFELTGFEHLSGGLFLLALKDEDGRTSTFKVVKQ